MNAQFATGPIGQRISPSVLLKSIPSCIEDFLEITKGRACPDFKAYGCPQSTMAEVANLALSDYDYRTSNLEHFFDPLPPQAGRQGTRLHVGNQCRALMALEPLDKDGLPFKWTDDYDNGELRNLRVISGTLLRFYRSLSCPVDLDLGNTEGGPESRWQSETGMVLWEAFSDSPEYKSTLYDVGVGDVRNVLAEAVVPLELLYLDLEHWAEIHGRGYPEDLEPFDWELVPRMFGAFYDFDRNQWRESKFGGLYEKGGLSFALVKNSPFLQSRIEMADGLLVPISGGREISLPWRIKFHAVDALSRVDHTMQKS